MAKADEITVSFPEVGRPNRFVPIVFDGDHVLTAGLVGTSKLATITVQEASRRLSAAAATGRLSAYHILRDSEKDAVVVEFREGAAQRASELERDAVDVNGEPWMSLLYGAGRELEGVVVWHASRWLSVPVS